MKNQKTKHLTLMLASAIGAAALTGAVYSTVAANADEASATTYSVTDVFSTSNATSVGTDCVAFDLKDGGKFTLKQRDLALKWYDAKNSVKYLNVELALADSNFKTVTLALETASAVATVDGKTTNKLVFTAEGGKVYAAVNPEENATATAGQEVDITKNIVITLGEDNTGFLASSVFFQ